MSIVFNNAQLPNIVRPERIGWLSGFGWGLGYVGGLIALLIVLAASMPAMFGWPPTTTILFGLRCGKPRGRAHHRAGLVDLAAGLRAADVPVHARPAPRHLSAAALHRARAGGLAAATLRQLRQYRNMLTFMIAFMFYNDGLAAIIAFGGVYASATFGWTTITLGIFGIILTVFAIPGAFLGGKLDDLHGSKPHGPDRDHRRDHRRHWHCRRDAPTACFLRSGRAAAARRALFGSTQEQVFMAFALLLGFCIGPMQAASRTLIGRLAPEGMTGEFYGLFALSGRATAWMAPIAIGIVTARPAPPDWASPACWCSWCWASCCCSRRSARSGPPRSRRSCP